MRLYSNQVEAAVRAVSILSPTRFAWFDQAAPSLPRKTRRALDAQAARTHLVSTLRNCLYTAFYTTGSPLAGAAPPPRPARRPDFVDRLSAANDGAGCWSAGWVLRSIEGGAVIGERDQLRLRAPAGSWRTPAREEARIGGRLELLGPKEQLGISPGFYLAQGNVELPASDDSRIVRVYWNTSAAGALTLMASLTAALNERGLAFRFKVVSDPDCFVRCDAAVLYLQQEDFDEAAPALARARAAAAPEIADTIPAFTKRLAPGVALAEDPNTGVSFGSHRCSLVAEGIVDARERRLRALRERVDRVRERFLAAGLSLEAPYLNAGSRDRYPLLAHA